MIKHISEELNSLQTLQTTFKINDCSPKNENAVIIYLPSCRSKPVWVSFFCYFEHKCFSNQTVDLHSMEKNTSEVNVDQQQFGYTFFKISSFVFSWKFSVRPGFFYILWKFDIKALRQ